MNMVLKNNGGQYLPEKICTFIKTRSQQYISSLSQKYILKKSAWGACSINSQSKASVRVNSEILQILAKLSNSLCEVTLWKVPLL